ncbi:MAG: hypothetical protein L0229_24355 [Blastocatellia bacterium]|nr:hypothetical protein [Blastocatellia bacterium]
MQKRAPMFCISLLIGFICFECSPAFAQKGANEVGQERQEEKMRNESESEPPLACVMSAMTDEQRRRQKALFERLRSSVQEVKELSDGYAFRFTAETGTILSVAEFISLERLCCPFLKFELEVADSSRPLWLRMTGREGVKDFLKAELGIR